MPTKQTPDDAELSRLLNKAEPPKSPEHLDSVILRYAKENTPQTEKPMAWFSGRPWAAAVATLSIAVVAISVTIGGFNRGELERATLETAFESDLVLQEAAGETIEPFTEAAPASVALEEAVIETFTEERDILVVDSVDPVDAANSPNVIISSDENINRERQVAQNNSTASNSTLTQAEPTVASVGFSAGALAVADGAGISDQSIDDDIQFDLVETEQLELARAVAAPAELSQSQAAPSQSSLASTSLASTTNDTPERLQLANTNAVNASNEPVAQSALASSSPASVAAPQSLRRSATTAVRNQELATTANEILVAPENLLVMLTLLEELMANEQLGSRGDEVRPMDTNERASELLATYTAVTERDASQQTAQDNAIDTSLETLLQLNARYAELRSGFTEFLLPLSLANAVEQVQLLDI